MVRFGGWGVGAVVTTEGWLGGLVGWSGWLRPQPAAARLATSRAVAMVRMGRMLIISRSRNVVESMLVSAIVVACRRHHR